jgi:hypothetical protein
MTAQILVAATFASACFFFSINSYWLLIPAVLHGGLMAAWILRHFLHRIMDEWLLSKPRSTPVSPDTTP